MPQGTGRPLTRDEIKKVTSERAKHGRSFVGMAVDLRRERMKEDDELRAMGMQMRERGEPGPRTNRERELIERLYKKK